MASVIEPDPRAPPHCRVRNGTGLCRCRSSAAVRKNAARRGCWMALSQLFCPARPSRSRKLLHAGTDLITLQVHPVSPELQSYLQRYMPAHSGDLVGIASRWADFQRIAQTMLVAAGFDSRMPTRPRRGETGLEARPRHCGRAWSAMRAIEDEPSRWLPSNCLPASRRDFHRRPSQARRIADFLELKLVRHRFTGGECDSSQTVTLADMFDRKRF